MKITICGSMQFHKEMAVIKVKLEQLGHIVYVPSNIEDTSRNESYMETDEEKILLKIEHDLVREHFEKVMAADAILVVNYEKKGIPGYIGGNTFLEMGIAFWEEKKIFLLYQIPEMEYKTEMFAMQPHILNGDLAKII